jgi:hypothetical protein
MSRFFFINSCFLFFSTVISAFASAQSDNEAFVRKFEVGQEVLRYDLGWKTCVVQSVDKNLVTVEFDGMHSRETMTHKAGQLRYVWEPRVLSKTREFSDASGKFKIRACVVGLNTIKQEANLMKIPELEEIVVSIGQLSKDDQAFFKKLAASLPPTPPEPAEVLEFNITKSIFDNERKFDSPAKLQPDPPKVEMRLPMAGASFKKWTPFEEIQNMHVLGGDKGWIVAKTTGQAFKNPSRIVWASLTDKKVVASHVLPELHNVVDIHGESNQIATLAPVKNSDAHAIHIWKSDPNKPHLEPVIAYSVGDTSSDTWGKFISADQFLSTRGSQNIAMVDLKSKREVYRVNTSGGANSFQFPIVSPGNRYVGLNEHFYFRVIDTSNGRNVVNLRCSNRLKAMAFDPQGERLALINGNELFIYKLGEAEPLKRINLGLRVNWNGTLSFLNSQYLMIDEVYLFDLTEDIIVWSYHSDRGVENSGIFDRRNRHIVDGKLVYAADTLWNLGNELVVGAVELPGPKVKEAIGSIDLTQINSMPKGTPVKLNVVCGVHNQEAKRRLEKAISAIGWIVDPTAKFTVTASITPGEEKKFSWISPLDLKEHTAKIQLMEHKVEITDDKRNPLWVFSVQTGLPDSVYLRDTDETMTKNIERNAGVHLGIFERVLFPEKMISANYQSGFGVSLYGLNGLTIQKFFGPAKPEVR